MPKVEPQGKKLELDRPYGMVNSVRIVLHRADRLTVILRRGKGGLFGLVGGKIHVFERSRTAGIREVREETELELSGCLRHEGTLKMVGRTIWYSVEKYRELGFSFPLEADPQDLVQLWNPWAELYSGLALGPLKNGTVEGRDVIELKLSAPGALEQIKPRHRPVLKAWRDFVAEGKPLPNEFVWEESKNSR